MSRFHLDRLLTTMISNGATDMLLLPGLPPQIRVNAVLRGLQTKSLTAADIGQLVESVAPEPKRKELAEHGQTVFSYAHGDAERVWLKAARHLGGESVVLRLYGSAVPSLEELGLPRIIRALCSRPRGLLLVVGSSGSGKATALGCMVNHVNDNFPFRIITIQKPIKFAPASKKSMVMHWEVGTHVHDYVSGIRNVGGEDANVVLVGDLGDDEVTRAALELAAVACLVLASMRVRGVADAVNRLRNACLSPDALRWRAMLADTLIAVVHRELCRGAGGSVVSVHEFMVVTPAIADLIRQDQLDRMDVAIATGRKYGMQLLDEQLWDLYIQGVIEAGVAIDHSRQPGRMRDRVEAHRRGRKPRKANGSDDSDDGPGDAPFPAQPQPSPPAPADEATPDAE
ncbi:MAG TPA: ATPase, T2SS/T4P/T4SS family [Phycisphaerae bacterium]|nr:ATPase, T2SS/T4P/T4SS family [Phycisphaerae bacterium]HNU47071.1 ATPase, T2SS/T4P/T4SS family [Phycisphaerae bacterium]